MPIIISVARCRVLLVLLAAALAPAVTAGPAAALAAPAAALAPAATLPRTAAAAAVDSFRITDPGPVLAGSVYDLTITGVSLHHATAYLFVDYAGCAATLAGELRRAPHAYDSYSVSGSFAQVTGWKSSSPGTDHACAYLAARGGRTLATARMPFVIR